MALKTLLKAFSGDPIANLESKLQAAADALRDVQAEANDAILAVETGDASGTAREYADNMRRKLATAEQRHRDLSGALTAARQRVESERLQAEAETEHKHREALIAANTDTLRTAENVQMTLDKLKIKLDEFRATWRALGALDSNLAAPLVDMDQYLQAHLGQTLGIKASLVAPEVLSAWQSRIPPV
jgi:DNA repair exonuclease SbcCD ATPase subunit